VAGCLAIRGVDGSDEMTAKRKMPEGITIPNEAPAETKQLERSW